MEVPTPVGGEEAGGQPILWTASVVILFFRKPSGGSGVSLGQKLFVSPTLINAECENIFCCTSVVLRLQVKHKQL